MNALQRDLKKLVPLVESLGKANVESDPHRQQFHLQPPVGWLNDPNGLCVYGGQYHAFFQYGPFDVTGGVKHWGHAVSTDLLHWEPRPVMLYPDEPFDCHGAYSGSALVEDGTMYLYYTGNVKHPGDYDYIKQGRGHNVCLAVSRDGVTLASKQCLLYNKDYPAGLTCHVRDPKVFAYEGKYYMVLGARTLEDKGEVLVLESTDKLHWTHINTLTTPEPFGYMWECPASSARTSTAAATSPSTATGAGNTRWANSTRWTPGLTTTPPRALWTAPNAASSSAGWECRTPITATPPPWPTAGSTA